jgi:2-oxoglutarate dehydrogenase E1 component
MNLSHLFHGPNSGYVVELYELYLQDPESVDPEIRALFEKWNPEAAESTTTDVQTQDMDKIVATANLAQAIRAFGHLEADLDPLGGNPPGDSCLTFSGHNLTDEDLFQLPSSLVRGSIAEVTSNAHEAITKLRSVYSSKIGYDFYHLNSIEERKWFRDSAESGAFRPPNDPINERLLLESLTQVEVLERFLHRIFPGKFRFSIEGVDVMVPMLNEIVGLSAEAQIHHIFLGMAHRGRLNVMHHVMNKGYKGTLIKLR